MWVGSAGRAVTITAIGDGNGTGEGRADKCVPVLNAYYTNHHNKPVTLILLCIGTALFKCAHAQYLIARLIYKEKFPDAVI